MAENTTVRKRKDDILKEIPVSNNKVLKMGGETSHCQEATDEDDVQVLINDGSDNSYPEIIPGDTEGARTTKAKSKPRDGGKRNKKARKYL